MNEKKGPNGGSGEVWRKYISSVNAVIQTGQLRSTPPPTYRGSGVALPTVANLALINACNEWPLVGIKL